MDTNRPAPPASNVGLTGVPRPVVSGEPRTPGLPSAGSPGGGIASKIQHVQSNLGRAADLEETIQPVERLPEPKRSLPVAESGGLAGAGAKITAFGREKRHEDSWSRTPNTTGSGAIHVKTFHCKLTDEALVYLDQNVNEWLDAHPQYEVKFVSTSIGTFTGKLKEPALICQVWV